MAVNIQNSRQLLDENTPVSNATGSMLSISVFRQGHLLAKHKTPAEMREWESIIDRQLHHPRKNLVGHTMMIKFPTLKRCSVSA